MPPIEDAAESYQNHQRLQEPAEDATQEPDQALPSRQPLLPAQDALIHTPLTQDARPEPWRLIAPTVEGTVERLAEVDTGAAAPVGTAAPTEATHHPTPADSQPVTSQNNGSTDQVTASQNVAELSKSKGTWNAVNSMQDTATDPVVVPSHHKPPGRRRRKAITLRNMDAEEEEMSHTASERLEDGHAAVHLDSSGGRSATRNVRKRKAPAMPTGDEQSAKRNRQPRRVNSKSTVHVEEEANAEAEAVACDAESGHGDEERPSMEDGVNRETDMPTMGQNQPVRKRKRQPTSQVASEQRDQRLKRKGRQPRAPTPSDAEDEVIDEDDVFMGDLARRDVRRGRLSQRERKMRTINWDEVRQRQKEKEAEQMNSRALQEKMLQEEQEREDAARTVQEQVRYEIVDGQTRIVQGSGQVDHERLAEARFTETVVEEDDFTNRINARSFMRNNKRYPEEFLLPGQGKRWDVRSTADFYDALRMFGTDFGMMTSLFDGVSRRSLKLKFTREEKKNPDVVKEILQQKNTRLKDWDEFLRASGKQNKEYDRVEEIKRDLEKAEEEGRILIQEAKKDYEEEMRQRKLAGLASEEENGEKATANKKKKGKRGKGKEATFQNEEGVEILNVDEHDGWGEE